MQIAILGIDLGKNSCSVVGLDDGGRVVVRRRMHRASVIRFAGSLTPCVVAMEACCGAHHLGRLLRTQGHEVRLMFANFGHGGPDRLVHPEDEDPKEGRHRQRDQCEIPTAQQHHDDHAGNRQTIGEDIERRR